MGLGRLQFLLVQKLGLKARYLMKVCRCMFPLLRIGRVEFGRKEIRIRWELNLQWPSMQH